MSGAAETAMTTEIQPKVEIKPTISNGHVKAEASGSGSSGSLTPLNGNSPIKPEPIELLNDDGDDDVKVYDNKVKVEEHRQLYAAEEKKLKDQEPPPAARLQDE